MLTHLLDTSVYSQRLRPHPLPAVVKHWQRLGDDALCISAICEAEILFGLEKRNAPRLWTEYRHYLEDKLALIAVDKSVVIRFGQLKTEMEARGAPRADFDLLIAATALSRRLILATCNPKHFGGIDSLRVEDWRV
jgi:tRNA(fMet)-specific endonuclease VapC